MTLDDLKARLTDEVLDAAIDAITEWERGDTRVVRCASSFAEMREVIVSALAPLQGGTCATCRHWLPHNLVEHIRAQCNLGVSGSTAEKASHHPYPITRRDFGCTLHQPTPPETETPR